MKEIGSKTLTKTEKEILELSRKGLTVFAISKKLNMPESTVSHCLDNVNKKLNNEELVEEDVCGEESLIDTGRTSLVTILLSLFSFFTFLNVQLLSPQTLVDYDNIMFNWRADF
ncbi:MAG: hypothetical protein IH845_00530 [Nanoarchaeota archaeon]|nr:hypothetical protein [Nanoarchaeota archaeon]